MKTLTCPECKNDVDLSAENERAGLEEPEVGDIIECDSCGITLSVTNTDGEEIETEIVDEGK